MESGGDDALIMISSVQLSGEHDVTLCMISDWMSLQCVERRPTVLLCAYNLNVSSALLFGPSIKVSNWSSPTTCACEATFTTRTVPSGVVLAVDMRTGNSSFVR